MAVDVKVLAHGRHSDPRKIVIIYFMVNNMNYLLT